MTEGDEGNGSSQGGEKELAQKAVGSLRPLGRDRPELVSRVDDPRELHDSTDFERMILNWRAMSG